MTLEQLLNKLTIIAMCLQWLIGLNITLILLGYIGELYTYNSFMRPVLETLLCLLLVSLFITTYFIANLRHRKEGESYNHFQLSGKDLLLQITFLMCVSIIFIIKFLTY